VVVVEDGLKTEADDGILSVPVSASVFDFFGDVVFLAI